MNKGPFITSIILLLTGIALAIVGAILYATPVFNWLFWIGIVIINIGLIIFVISFIKKPGAALKEAKEAKEASA